MRLLLKPALFLSLIALMVAAGCQSGKETGSEESTRVNELHEIATVLRLYCGQHNRGPSRPADLAPYEAGAPLGYPAVRSGEIVVVWGAMMPGEGETGTDAVIAFEKKTSSQGGYVLLHNGTVKEMTANEFSAAVMAK